jgi:glycosyltransferase involved in cell wall biosynthesis
MPTVSVLLPVYNALPDLPRALRSLQAQTFTDFEIIAIDDGSTDGSGELLDQTARTDPRLKVFHQPNAGALGKVLNRAAELAEGKYLARQDADDASAATRLAAQVSYLQSHPKTGLCGSWAWFIDAELGPLFSLELPDNHARLCHFLNIGKNPFVHGSILVRAELFQKTGGYRGSYVEDFDLWLRMSELTRLGICPTLGYYYWRSVSGISAGAHLRQQALVKLVLKMRAERVQTGREVSSWADEYQKIMRLPTVESNPVERQTSMQYARGLQLLRRGWFDAARGELVKAAAGQGQYAQKARRNLSVFWAAPALARLYGLLESQEPEQYARRLPPGSTLPDYI